MAKKDEKNEWDKIFTGGKTAAEIEAELKAEADKKAGKA